MKSLALAAFLLASPAYAQVIPPPDFDPEPYRPVAFLSYILGGGDYRGQVIRGEREDTSSPVRARGRGFGQDMRGAVHSRDRGKVTVALKDSRSSQVARGGIGGFLATIRDLGDQGRSSPASVTIRRADGTVLDRVRIAGGSTRKWNGNTRTVTFAGWIPGGSVLEVRAGPGKMNRERHERGKRGQGDGFSVKVATIPDCPPGDDDRMHVTTSRQTVGQAPTRDRGERGGKSGKGGRGRK